MFVEFRSFFVDPKSISDNFIEKMFTIKLMNYMIKFLSCGIFFLIYFRFGKKPTLIISSLVTCVALIYLYLFSNYIYRDSDTNIQDETFVLLALVIAGSSFPTEFYLLIIYELFE